LKEFPFLSEEEKTNPPTQQTWEEIRNPKLRRHPDCKKILVEELIDDHGMEGSSKYPHLRHLSSGLSIESAFITLEQRQ